MSTRLLVREMGISIGRWSGCGPLELELEGVLRNPSRMFVSLWSLLSEDGLLLGRPRVKDVMLLPVPLARASRPGCWWKDFAGWTWE